MAVILNWIDILALILYFLLVIGFGIWSSFKNRGSIGGYFLAGRSMHFLPIAASLYSSNIGSVHFIGFAGSGAAGGIHIAGYEIYGPVMLIILGWMFLPVYIKAGVFTMPEYIKKRFGGERIAIYLSILSLLLYIFTKISADLYAGALFINLSLDFNLYISIGILLVLAALFTIGGGLNSVMWTDFIQTVVMMIGAVYLMIVSFAKVGGFQGMKQKFGYAVPTSTLLSNSTCGIPPKDYFNMIKAIDSDFPWTGLLLGQLINGVWYVCNDQVMVQRVLAAKNLTHAKAGCVGCGYIKLLSLFLMVMPGMIARILFRDDVACSDPVICKKICGNAGGCTNVAYPNLVMTLLPTGARGVMIAVMMAALMSSLTSIFNSTSTIFTMDIWKRFRKDAKDWELMIVGRVCVIVLVFVSILWIPILQASQGSQLFDYIQSVTSFLAPPVCALYVQALFFKRINEQGAFWGLVAGFITGITRFIWQNVYSEPVCNANVSSPMPAIISKVHYLHFSVILFTVTMVVSWCVSLVTKPIDEKHIRKLTFFTKNEEEDPVPIENNINCLNCFSSKRTEIIDEPVVIEPKMDEMHQIEFESSEGKKIGIFKKLFFWFCGIESHKNSQKESNSHESEQKLNHNLLEEDKLWSGINDANALFQLCLCGFMWVFFNKFD